MRKAYQQDLRAFLAGVMPGRENALVFGEGPEKPVLMLIGEAPGEQESLQGRPFVGKAGKNLDHFLELAGLKREEIYISNAVKYRPTKIGKTGRVSNRPPTREEIALFRPWLLREIAEVRPKMIATLGNVPLGAVTGGRQTIGAVHGTVITAGETGLPLFALYHPASLIYNRSLTDLYEQDVRALAEKLHEISDAKTDI
ncbi:MAG: uracil-DNA glycosylase [Clostridiales bacterium]|nr:uracil-DNA glycosylase [Clostridiales bacterium]